MNAIGFVLFFVGMMLVLIIGRPCPRAFVAIPILSMVGIGFLMMLFGFAEILWKVMP
ncbi:hypothetical protein [Paraburkholderia tropica]|uniref:hypothetical protein n=1 Tax=Paraburkholderia tropica TaxID=92647 RepID=UPI002AB7C31D|nr:hypothetical protein [Paraburkholderia tropica]